MSGPEKDVMQGVRQIRIAHRTSIVADLLPRTGMTDGLPICCPMNPIPGRSIQAICSRHLSAVDAHQTS